MRPISYVIGAAAILIAAGCGSGSGGEMPPDEYKLKSEQTTIASKAFGEKRDWSALTADEKAPFLKGNGGDEAKAKAGFDKIVAGLRYFQGGAARPGG